MWGRTGGVGVPGVRGSGVGGLLTKNGRGGASDGRGAVAKNRNFWRGYPKKIGKKGLFSLKFVPNDNDPKLVEIMAWLWTDKPLPEPKNLVYWRIYTSLALDDPMVLILGDVRPTPLSWTQSLISIRSSDNDSTGLWPPGSLHTLGADGHI